MKTQKLAGVGVGAAIGIALQATIAAAAPPPTWFGIAVVTRQPAACKEWYVGRPIRVDYRPRFTSGPAPALRFSVDSMSIVYSSKEPGDRFMGGPIEYEGQLQGGSPNLATFTGIMDSAVIAPLANGTIGQITPNTRHIIIDPADFTNWANIPGCNLGLRAMLIRR